MYKDLGTWHEYINYVEKKTTKKQCTPRSFLCLLLSSTCPQTYWASFVVSLFVFNWVLPYILQVLIASAILFYPGLILIDHGHFQYPLTFCQRKVLIYSLLYPSSKYKGGSRTQKKYRDKQILSYFLCKFWIDNCEFFKCSEFEIYFYHHSILLQGLTSLPPSLWLRYTLSCKCEDCLFI